MRLKFFKRSAEKIVSRIDPDREANRDLRIRLHQRRVYLNGNPGPGGVEEWLYVAIKCVTLQEDNLP